MARPPSAVLLGPTRKMGAWNIPVALAAVQPMEIECPAANHGTSGRAFAFRGMKLPTQPPSQFEQVVLPQLDSIYRAAVALCGDRHQAEDLAQVAVLKALESFGSFRPGTNIKAWLMRILRNSWIDQLRRRKTSPAPQALPEQLAGRESVSPAESSADGSLAGFTEGAVLAALGELPEDQRLALYLLDVEEMSLAEVAEIMDVAVGTVKSRSSRGRAQLRQRLEAWARQEGYLRRS